MYALRQYGQKVSYNHCAARVSILPVRLLDSKLFFCHLEQR